MLKRKSASEPSSAETRTGAEIDASMIARAWRPSRMTRSSPVSTNKAPETGDTRSSTGRNRLNTPICTTWAEAVSVSRRASAGVLHIAPHLSAHPRRPGARNAMYSYQQVEARCLGWEKRDHVAVAAFLRFVNARRCPGFHVGSTPHSTTRANLPREHHARQQIANSGIKRSCNEFRISARDREGRNSPARAEADQRRGFESDIR